MKQNNKRGRIWSFFFTILTAGALFTATSNAVTVNVVDPDGVPITTGFRWLLEEDNTNVTIPGVPVRVSISTDIHNSHAPVVASGQTAGGTTDIIEDASGSALDPNKRYFVSVLPDSGFSNSGTTVVAPNPGAVTVIVNPLPLPTAQISIFAFVDHNPINNVFDEHDQGLGGAVVLLSDTAGMVTQDAFGNPLGTQYTFDAVTGEALVDVDGNPIIDVAGSGAIITLTQDEHDLGGTANPYNLRVGEAIIKYLVPGKYGLVVTPPVLDDAGANMTCSQTSTI